MYTSLMVRLLENTIKFVLSTLRDNLFAFKHMSIFSISSVSIWFMYVVSISSINRFVSSAKRRVNNLVDTEGRSLTYKRNKSGPKIDPCVTPHVISFSEDLTL